VADEGLRLDDGGRQEAGVGLCMPQWLALCALKTACILPIGVVGAGFAKPKPLKMHCGQAVGAEPPGVELKVFTVFRPPK